MGLLDNFVATTNIQSSMKSERTAARNAARDFAKTMCKGCAKGVKFDYMSLGAYETYANFEKVPCFYSIGSTFIRMQGTNCTVTANCDTKYYAYNCASTWALRDEFSNPLVIGPELGGVPYDIIANWFDLFEGNGAF